MTKEPRSGLAPPTKSAGVLSDLRSYFLARPAIPTLIRFPTPEERLAYSRRIIQRLGISMASYEILNIHRIGIGAPASHVFEELLRWNGDGSCWPNHVAQVRLSEEGIERVQLYLFGRTRWPFRLGEGRFGLGFVPLFNLRAIRFQMVPDPAEIDSARYLLYECSGGYPIGLFAAYVRASIPEEGETEPAQLFFLVGFNFYGRREWSKGRLFRAPWEAVHNRVTANVLNRVKQLCEWHFERLQRTGR
jgi:hypothetical protein